MYSMSIYCSFIALRMAIILQSFPMFETDFKFKRVSREDNENIASNHVSNFYLT